MDPSGTSSECKQCNAEMIENGYRRLRCPDVFEAVRDVVEKLNIRKRSLKTLRIKADLERTLAPRNLSDDRCIPE